MNSLCSSQNDNVKKGFTLIEMSIVLVIIGLLVGGVLVGRDLVKAAEVRATITQVEKYNQAVNTFRDKYSALPGDIADPGASSFGFQPRGPLGGEGDGNGIIMGNGTALGTTPGGQAESKGETVVFWADLSTVHLIDGQFNTASTTTEPSANISGSGLNAYFPSAKLGQGNYIYVYSGGVWNGSIWADTGINYFGLSAISQLYLDGEAQSSPGLTVNQAYAIDQKIDDGLPQSGRVTATYVDFMISNNFVPWAAGGGVQGANSGSPNYGPSTAATPGSSTTCYDNGNVAGATQQYSVEISGGANVNCALSFRFP